MIVHMTTVICDTERCHGYVESDDGASLTETEALAMAHEEGWLVQMNEGKIQSLCPDCRKEHADCHAACRAESGEQLRIIAEQEREIVKWKSAFKETHDAIDLCRKDCEAIREERKRWLDAGHVLSESQPA